MKAYSQDLRERVLRAVGLGRPHAEIVQLFGVSLATVKWDVKQRRDKGHVRPKAIPKAGEMAFLTLLRSGIGRIGVESAISPAFSMSVHLILATNSLCAGNDEGVGLRFFAEVNSRRQSSEPTRTILTTYIPNPHQVCVSLPVPIP